MVLNSLIITIIFFLAPIASSTIKENIRPLTKIESKQTLSNLRFINSDGKLTFYQKNIGGLFLSKNYKLSKLLPGEKYSHFNVRSGTNGIILIQRDNTYYSHINPIKEKDIFYFKDGKVRQVGTGINAELHSNDEWVSFYRPFEKILYLKKITLPPKTLRIKINSVVTPYFTPNIHFHDESKYFYTDTNSNGEVAIIKKEKNKTTVIKKFVTAGTRIEFCNNKEDLFVGVFHTSKLNRSSKIFSQNSNNINLSEESLIYESKYNDIGHINCHYFKDKILFLKTFKHSETDLSELVSLNLKNKALTQLTKSKFTHQFFQMGKRVFVVIDGIQYLIFGNKELVDDRIPSEGTREK